MLALHKNDQMVCRFKKYTLHFKHPGGTSRGILYDKDTYFIIMEDGRRKAFGECNLFKNLSADDRPGYEKKLAEVCLMLPVEREKVLSHLLDWPSIYFGVEMLLKDWNHGGERMIFPESISKNGFTVPTNGLIWMGSVEQMHSQIRSKLDLGYTSIKLKIGAIDFESELQLLKLIRKEYNASLVELRLDANGAFSAHDALEKLQRLSEYGINYIEQPIKQGQWEEMAKLVASSPIKIALDEELIGLRDEKRVELLDTVKPHGLILKPALIGGFSATDAWRKLIEDSGGFYVITSALESNIGLNAIAQYTALQDVSLPQGLGTGQLFTNNFPSPYTVDSKGLHYNCELSWDLNKLK